MTPDQYIMPKCHNYQRYPKVQMNLPLPKMDSVWSMEPQDGSVVEEYEDKGSSGCLLFRTTTLCPICPPVSSGLKVKRKQEKRRGMSTGKFAAPSMGRSLLPALKECLETQDITSLPDPMRQVNTYGKTLPLSHRLDSSWELSPFRLIHASTGTGYGHWPKEDFTWKSPLGYVYYAIGASELSKEICDLCYQWLGTAGFTGVKLELANPVVLGKKQDLMLTLKTQELNFGNLIN